MSHNRIKYNIIKNAETETNVREQNGIEQIENKIRIEA